MIAATRQPINRSLRAKEARRRLEKPDWIASIIRESKTVADSLRNATRTELHGHTQKLRKYLHTGVAYSDPQLLSLAAGAVITAVDQELGLRLFDVQLHAGIIVSCGAVAEMATGEGKTLSGVLPAYVNGITGRGVHVATTNDYLAERDHAKLTAVFARLGLSTGLLRDSNSLEETRDAYRADITFAPGHMFGFDYLRDQLTIQESASRIGQQTLNRVIGQSVRSRLRQRGLNAAIIDEIDHVLIDDAVSPLLLSSSSEGCASDAEVHILARDFAETAQPETDFRISPSGSVQLTKRGFDRVYEQTSAAIHDELLRPWHEYVVLALRAKHVLLRDVHYVVKQGEVQIVDTSTGRIFEDRTWSDGLQQAVLAAEGLTISPETRSLARITRQRFYRYYENIGGMTGTATGCETEFADVYGLAVVVVPRRAESQRRIETETISISQQDKIAAIAKDVSELYEEGRAVLIGTLNIAQSHQIAEELERRDLPFELLNGVQDADEAAVVARAGQEQVITVATNLAGRGTDIGLAPKVKARGGLHVIVVQRHSLSRVDRQLIGRCARCGDPGTARFYTASDDELIANHAPWVGRAIKRQLNAGETQSPSNQQSIKRHIERAQALLQKRATQMRMQLLELDQETQLLLDRDVDHASCWEL